MRARVRGIYATALTRVFLATDHDVVQASGPIRRRFDVDFEAADHDVTVETTDDRQGVGAVGDPDAVATATALLRDVAVDAFAWTDPAPRGAVFDGRVTETLGGGAVVDLGRVEADANPVGADGAIGTGDATHADDVPPSAPAEGESLEGYLPYDTVDEHVSTGDALRVQVTDGVSPWADDRPVLDTDLRAVGGLATLVRGREGTTVATRDDGAGRELAGMTDLLGADPPEGWGVRWSHAATEADMDALDAALRRTGARAEAVEAALDAAGEEAGEPRRLVAPTATTWTWFGRESRFALDARRREVATTMPGHHRTKAASRAASAGVDFAEAVCEPAGEFPFGVVTDQFGPVEGDSVRIGHGKPTGRLVVLGRGEVVERGDDGTLAVRREMRGGGRYDALGTPKADGDTALTKFREGRWWYPTVYRSADGERKGTYVNVSTPVECFPDEVRYVDLYVDVVKHPDGRVERVDDDELDEAETDGLLSPELAEKARDVASSLETALSK